MPRIFGTLGSLWAIACALALTDCTENSFTSESRLVPESSDPLDMQPEDLAFLNRLSWGANTPEAQFFAGQGTSAYLEHQLHPTEDDGLPQAVRGQIRSLTIEREPLGRIAADLRGQRDELKTVTDPTAKGAANAAYQKSLTELGREAALRSVLRDLYSKNQLKEQLTWFWLNHFNVSMNKADIRALVGDYEEHAIRPHVLGHFRDLLAATLHHPAMLRYLDNAQNGVGHINENYAREIMELHTLGVDGGYTQNDVQELARILTGVGINENGKTPKIRAALKDQYVREGLFEFNPNRHDYGSKAFLGRFIGGSGLNEVDEAVNLLARAPATAHFISRKLAVYFCSDEPSAALIDHMAESFQATDGDIAAVLRTLFTSNEFKVSLGHKLKDPIHFALSALRATYGTTVIINPTPLIGWLNRMSEPLYGRETPDGYPMIEAAWSGPGEMEARFEIARQIGSGHNGLFKAPGSTGAEPPVAPQIALTRYYGAIAPYLGAATAQSLAQAKSPQDFNLLFLSSPKFMHR